MTRHFDSDPLLEEWLAEGPSQLPDHAIDGIVRRLDETQQRKHWWLPGRGNMNRSFFALGGAAAAVVVAVLALGIYFNRPGIVGPPAGTPTPAPVASPTPQATANSTPTPTAEPEAKLFVSERHGYSLRLPGQTWGVIERPGEWDPNSTLPDGRGEDSLLAPLSLGYRHSVFLNSGPLPADVPFDRFLHGYDQGLRGEADYCVFDEAYGTSIVDGVEARIDTAVCNGDRWAQATWLHGGRVFVLRVGEHPDSAVPIDPRQEIEVWLGRITLHEPQAVQEFVSQRYWYSLQLPDDGWTVLERPGEWQPGQTFTGADPGVDVVRQRAGQRPRYLHDVVINSQPLDVNTSIEGWLEEWARIQRRDFPNCAYDDGFEMTSADDGVSANARIWTAVCDGDRWAEAIWTVDFIAATTVRRVYVLRIGENRLPEVQIDPLQELHVWLDRIEITGRRWW